MPMFAACIPVVIPHAILLKSQQADSIESQLEKQENCTVHKIAHSDVTEKPETLFMY